MSPFFIRKQHESRGLFALKIAGVALLGIIGISGLAILFGFIVMWLWNWLLPGLFGFQTITFWQGVGIVILARIIFGSIHHRSSSHRHRPVRHSDHAKRRWFERWEWYEDFWKEEGEKAFDAYVENRKARTGTSQQTTGNQ